MVKETITSFIVLGAIIVVAVAVISVSSYYKTPSGEAIRQCSPNTYRCMHFNASQGGPAVWVQNCSLRGAWTNQMKCGFGCENGKCLAQQNATQNASANVSLGCNDSDKGKDYYVFGIITLNGETKGNDSCAELANETYIFAEKGKYLNEYFCSNDSTFSKEFYICPDGCEKGICARPKSSRNSTINITSEPSGAEVYIRNSSSDKDEWEYIDDTPVKITLSNPGSKNTSGEIIYFYDYYINVTYKNQSETTHIILEAGENVSKFYNFSSECTDSDEEDYSKKGYIIDENGNKKTDKCKDTEMLTEYVCKKNSKKKLVGSEVNYSCADDDKVCYDGACIVQPSLIVTSDPSGATVRYKLANATKWTNAGQTPLNVSLMPGAYNLNVSINSTAFKTAKATLSAGKATKLFYNLTKG